MEDTRVKDQNDSMEGAVTEAVKGLSESLIAANEAMGRLLYVLGHMNCEKPESGIRPGKGVEQNAEQPKNQVSEDYEAVRHITVRDAVRHILEKSRFQIPEDCVSFRNGDGSCIEFRLAWYDRTPGIMGFIRRSEEEFSVCADNGLDGMVEEFDEHVAGLSVMHFHLKSGERGLWQSL